MASNSKSKSEAHAPSIKAAAFDLPFFFFVAEIQKQSVHFALSNRAGLL